MTLGQSRKEIESELFNCDLSTIPLSDLRTHSCELGDAISELQLQLDSMNVVDSKGQRLSNAAYHEWKLARKTELHDLRRRLRWLRNAIDEMEKEST